LKGASNSVFLASGADPNPVDAPNHKLAAPQSAEHQPTRQKSCEWPPPPRTTQSQAALEGTYRYWARRRADRLALLRPPRDHVQKKSCTRLSRIADVAAARKELKAEQHALKPSRLVFIDETAVTTKITRLYGRALLGERLVAKVPYGHWKTLTLVAALRVDSVTAPYVIDGAMDGRSFLSYVEQVLVPTLRMRDIVFMDNVRNHKVAGVREAIEAAGAERYLPAYSPDLDPIENPRPAQKRRPHRPRTLEAGRTQREGDCTLRDPTSDNGSDRSLINFMGDLSVFAWLLPGSYIIPRYTELY
jgi:transposase